MGKILDPILLLGLLKDAGYDVHYMDGNETRRSAAVKLVGNRSVWDMKPSGRSTHHPDILVLVNSHELDPRFYQDARMMAYHTLEIYIEDNGG